MVNFSKKIFATISLVFAASVTANAASYSKDPYVVTDNLTNTTTVVLTPIFQGAYTGDSYGLSHGLEGYPSSYDNDYVAIAENRNAFMIYDLNSFTSAGLDFSKLQSVSLWTSPLRSVTTADGFALSVWNVTTDINTLLVPQTNRSDIFLDLQSGIKYSSVNADFDIVDQYNLIFNSAGMNAVKMSPGLFAVGLSINTLTDSNEDAMFPEGDNTHYLYLTFTTPVPEAETYGMMLAGLALVGLVRRRKK